MEKFSTRAQFQHDVVVLLRLAELNKLDDVRVIEVSHDLDFLEDVCSLPKKTTSAVDLVTGARTARVLTRLVELEVSAEKQTVSEKTLRTSTPFGAFFS